MSQFVELHLLGTNQQPFILNTDCVAYIKALDNGCIVYLSSVDIRGQEGDLSSSVFTLHVSESYYTLKELLRCK